MKNVEKITPLETKEIPKLNVVDSVDDIEVVDNFSRYSRMTPENNPAEIIEEYEKSAPGYEDRMLNKRGYTLPPIIAKIFHKYVEPTEDMKILDAGAGSGLIGQGLNEIGFPQKSIHGLDISSAMLKEAARKQVYEALVTSDLTKIPYANNSFDHSISVMTVGIAPASSLDELARVTKPGGYIATTIRPEILDEYPEFDETMKRLEVEGIWKLIHRHGPIQSYVNNVNDTTHYFFVFQKLGEEQKD